MTKKNAKKSAARARKEIHGGHYQSHLRQVGGGGGSSGDANGSAVEAKYVHVQYGTPGGTVWLLSDEPRGAVLRIQVPRGASDDDAFARAALPLINETSADGGKTWVPHVDDSALTSWRSALRLIYRLLGAGTGHWRAARIRARTGEELVRHPPKLLEDIANVVHSQVAGAEVSLHAPMDQLFVRMRGRSFAISTMMKMPTEWPVYVTPVPPPSEAGGSWECMTVDDVLSTLRWPQVQPRVRVASVEEIRAETAAQSGRASHRNALEPIIRELIVLAGARHREEEALEPQTGSPIYTGEELIAARRRPRPAGDALESALRRLDLSTLRKIEALMYAGREDEDVLVMYRQLPPDDQVVTAAVIASKVPLDEYLSDGLRLAHEQGVDLDALWPTRADAD